MISTPQDYQSLLYLIQNPNRPSVIIPLPKDEPIYEVDLKTRIINGPDLLSVRYDHKAEWIYFKVDRYFDNVDLATMNCIIQYNNANPDKKKRGYVYAPPFIDIVTLKDENKIIIPWLIEGPATAYEGKVEFALKFYRMASNGVLLFNLNTLSTVSNVLKGMDIFEETENYVYDQDTIEEIYARIEEVSRQSDLYWIEV